MHIPSLDGVGGKGEKKRKDRRPNAGPSISVGSSARDVVQRAESRKSRQHFLQLGDLDVKTMCWGPCGLINLQSAHPRSVQALGLRSLTVTACDLIAK